MRTTVSISDPLLANAKQLAAQRGATLSDVVEDALRILLSKTEEPQGRTVRLPTFEGKLVDANLDLNRTSDLLARDDDEAYSRRRA